MQIALLSNDLMVSAFRNFAARVQETKDSPEASQQVLKVLFGSDFHCNCNIWHFVVGSSFIEVDG